MESGLVADVALEAADLLGEGPVWSSRERALYWVDIKARAVRTWHPASGRTRAWPVESDVGSMALRADGAGALLAVRTGFVFLDLDSGQVSAVHDPEPEEEANRFNDGKCDPQGRFWAGTMHDAEEEDLGALYRLDADLSCHRVLTGICCSNGLGWSPDGSVMYHTDTWKHRIDAFDFDPATGEVANRRTFADIPPEDGAPDGLAVDADGCVWSARWDGWRVVRHAPSGEVEDVVRMPVPRPTSCAFGGEGLDQLYVTSARAGLDGRALAQAPLSGAVFRIDAGTRGRPVAEFAG